MSLSNKPRSSAFIDGYTKMFNGIYYRTYEPLYLWMSNIGEIDDQTREEFMEMYGEFKKTGERLLAVIEIGGKPVEGFEQNYKELLATLDDNYRNSINPKIKEYVIETLKEEHDTLITKVIVLGAENVNIYTEQEDLEKHENMLQIMDPSYSHPKLSDAIDEVIRYKLGGMQDLMDELLEPKSTEEVEEEIAQMREEIGPYDAKKVVEITFERMMHTQVTLQTKNDFEREFTGRHSTVLGLLDDISETGEDNKQLKSKYDMMQQQLINKFLTESPTKKSYRLRTIYKLEINYFVNEIKRQSEGISKEQIGELQNLLNIAKQLFPEYTHKEAEDLLNQ